VPPFLRQARKTVGVLRDYELLLQWMIESSLTIRARTGGGDPKVNDGFVVRPAEETKWEVMVGTARFELATPCTPSKCATRLRHVPTGSNLLIARAKHALSRGGSCQFYTRIADATEFRGR
jgi:hypothetical protein